MTEHDALVDNTDAKGWDVNPLFGSYCRKRKVPSIKKNLKKTSKIYTWVHLLEYSFKKPEK